MFIGCLINLIVYSGLVFGYYQWLSDTIDPPVLWLISGLAGLFSWLSLAAIYNIRQASNDRQALLNAKQGIPPQEGSWVAIAGQLEATGDTVVAPWSGRPCVICEYEINHEITHAGDDDTSSRTTTQVDFSGIAMSSCVIRSAQNTIRLLGYPNLENVPNQRCLSNQDLSRAKRYVQSTSWQDCSGLKLFRGMKDMLHDMATATGNFRFDWRVISMGNCLWLSDQWVTTDLDGARSESFLRDQAALQLLERRLESGDHVVALGVYDEMQRALTSPVTQSGQLIRIYKDNLDSVMARTGRSAWAKVVGGLIALIIVNGSLYFGHLLYCKSQDTQKRWSNQIRQAINQNDSEQVKFELKRLPNANLPDEQGKTLLMEVSDSQIAELLIQKGADVNAVDQSGNTCLMYAARSSNFELMKRLIAAGANIEATRAADGTTALIQAEAAGNEEVVLELVSNGAKNDRVTASNGMELTLTDNPVQTCLEYVRAIHAADPAVLARLSTANRKMQWDSVNWNAWHDSRPVNAEFISGYANNVDATVSLGGKTPADFSIEWIYQLKREEGQWQISRERSKVDFNR